MFSSSVARLTRQLTQLSVIGVSPPSLHGRSLSSSRVVASVVARNTRVAAGGASSSSSSSTPTLTLLSTRTFATTDGNEKATSAKTEESSTNANADADTSKDQPKQQQQQQQPFLQHQEWVKFQQSISVDGFQTGQVVAATVIKKSKGGKQARNRKARELERLQQLDPNFKPLAASGSSSASSKFPAIRYSPEETQELLELAFRTLPKRDGKRGTRNLKRQARRWKLVRNIRSKYKHEIQGAHERRMEHRHWKRQQTKAVKEAAPDICATDAQYQAQILKRWATLLVPTPMREPVTTTSGIAGDGNTDGPKMVASAKD